MDDRQGNLSKLSEEMKAETPVSPPPFKLGVNDKNILFSCTEEGEVMLGLIGCYEDDTNRFRVKIEVIDGNRFEIGYHRHGNVMSDKPDRTAYTKNAAVGLHKVKNVDLVPRTFRLMEVKHFFVDHKLILCPNAAEMRPPIRHNRSPVVIGETQSAAPAPVTPTEYTREEADETFEPTPEPSVGILVSTGKRDLMFNVPFNEALDTLSDWRARGLECT